MVEQESDLSDESVDFEDRECDQAIAFRLLGCISCFTHTLQLVVNKFSEITAFKGVLNHARTLQEKLLRNWCCSAVKNFVQACPTRWSSTYMYMINHMLKVQNSLTSVPEVRMGQSSSQ